MSKALVIKGADFSTNKVTTISFGSVPCEGISFASDTITITDGNPVTVEYTLTPSNTTDPVIWASSDTDVVTVSNGALTVVGIGTATLTATCGEYTATATVTVSIAYIANYNFISLAHADGKDFLSCSSVMSRLSAVGSGDQASQYNIPNSGGVDMFYPIILPGNTAKIRVNLTGTSNFYNNSTSFIHWMNNSACGDSNFPNAATYVSSESFNPRSSVPLEKSVPSGVDAVAIMFALTARQEEGTDPNTFATNNGVTLEFLAE